MPIRNTFAIPLAAGLVTLLLGIGVISAAGQSGTVSAKGSGQVAFTVECNPSMTNCVEGGKGAQFSFAFTGPAPTSPNVPAPATGTLSVKFRLTGDQVQFVTPFMAFIFPNDHFLAVVGACNLITTGSSIIPAGTFPGTCSSQPQEFTQPNSGNLFFLEYSGTAGFALAQGQVVSGGMQID